MIRTRIEDLTPAPAGRPRAVVIGSGAVGLYAAAGLQERGFDVVVIESGGANLGSFASDSFRSIGAAHEGIRIGRSRTLGGTTNLWGGQLVEFQPIDFANRDWMPGSTWPVTYEEIAPFYGPTYERLGIEHEAQDDAIVWKGVLGNTPRFQDDVEVFLTRWMRIPNFAMLFADAIEKRSDLQVLTSHTAVGFAGGSEHINSVRVASTAGRTLDVAGDVFVLAAGTIESVRLLLHCALSTDWRCPWRDNPNVGAFFQDHLGGRIATVHPIEKKRFFDLFSTIVWRKHKYQPKLRLTNDALAEMRQLNIHGMFAFESSVSENLVFLKQFVKAAIYSRKFSGFKDLIANAIGCARFLVPLMWRYIRDHRIFVPGSAKISLIMQGEHFPLRESRIQLDESWKDSNGVPRVLLDWKLAGDEVVSIRAFAERVDHALQAAGLARLEVPEALRSANPAFVSSLRDTNHQSGGAIMGYSASDGVVDRDLKVFGCSNLYVGGASTFRTTSNANVTFTAMAFATRLIDHLAEEYAVH